MAFVVFESKALVLNVIVISAIVSGHGNSNRHSAPPTPLQGAVSTSLVSVASEARPLEFHNKIACALQGVRCLPGLIDSIYCFPVAARYALATGYLLPPLRRFAHLPMHESHAAKQVTGPFAPEVTCWGRRKVRAQVHHGLP